jgi:hypothetical protein
MAIRKRARADSRTAEDKAAPQLLCLLLELREQMHEMNARLERIGAHVERIDAHVCRLERGGPSRAPPAHDAPGPFRVAWRARAMNLLDLPAELLVAIATQLAEDDELAAGLTCRGLRQAVVGTKRRAAGAWLSTRIGSAFCSVSKLEWAVLSCWLPLSGRLLLRAAQSGQIEQLSWLRAHGCEWEPREEDGEDPCSSAAEGGHLAVLQWARAAGWPWDEHTGSDAALNGHLHVLQWARANGCPSDEHTCTSAATGGHLAVLQWLLANGCPWDALTCAYAAEEGHLAVLQWLRANGCPWDGRVCQRAADNGHDAVLLWARANGCPENLPDGDH